MRTDTHSPTNLDPAAYEYVGAGDTGKVYGPAPEDLDPGYIDPAAKAAILEDGIDGHWRERGGCDHCGHHNIRYFAVYVHRVTGDALVIGEQCAGERFDLPSRAAWKLRQLRQDAASRRKRLKIKRLQAKALKDPATKTAVDFLEAKAAAREATEFYGSLLRQWNKKGELSEAQITAVTDSIERDREWQAEREAEREAQPDPVPVVEGKGVRIRGKVLTVKDQDSDYGWVQKMLVLDHRGFKVWGTVPLNIENFEVVTDGLRGHRIEFTANVETSNDDPCFGYFKRPRKAGIPPTETARR